MLPFMIATKKNMNQLQLIQNKCLKTLAKLPFRLITNLVHEFRKIERLEVRIPILVSNYLANAQRTNKSIQTILGEHKYKNNHIKKSKRSILDRININTMEPIPTTILDH